MSLSIRTKLIAFSVSAMVVAGVVGAIGIRGVRTLAESLENVERTGEAMRNHMEVDMMHDAIRADVLGALRAKEPPEQQAVLKDLSDHETKIRESLAKNGALALSNEVRTALSDVQKPLDEYIAAASKLVGAVGKSSDEANALVPDFMSRFSVLEDKLEQVSTLIEKTEQDAVKEAAAVKTQDERMMLGALGAGLVFSLISGVLLVRVILRPVRTLVDCMKDIAQGEGDLTRRVDDSREDELGELGKFVNQFIEKIERVVSEVKSGAVQIDAGGSQIASASQSMAQGASEQASSLQQISASLEEMSGQTQQAAENARQAHTLAAESKESADRGQKEMTAMTAAVNEIKASSGEISKIIKVIDEIAFQTNLLALNAAVEAARAGEAGKGFAVVAEEVRNLAQRSAEAAKSTSGMIEESVRRSENGVQIASRVGEALEEITQSTSKVNALLAEIASASNEQATGITQINQGVSQLDQVTQQNAGNSEELASSAEEMSSQVASLNQLVAQFKVRGEPAGVATRAARPPAPKPARPRPVPAAASKAKPVGKGKVESPIPMNDDEVLASF